MQTIHAPAPLQAAGRGTSCVAMSRIVVHCRAHAEAALAAAAALVRPVTLISPAAAAGYLGAAYFQAMVRQAAACHPAVHSAVLDCGHAPGRALGALRQGVAAVVLRGEEQVLARIADIAVQRGARLEAADLPALDLGTLPPAAWGGACHDWLSRTDQTDQLQSG